MTNIQVAVIGAGLSGLRVASLLERAGVDYRLIEARDRLGGRILTVDAAGVPGAGFDLGPSWYWPKMQPAIGALVDELGLAGFAQNGEGDVVFERMSREPARRYAGHPQEPQSMRLEGGTAALIRALAASVPVEKVMLDTSVTGLSLSTDGIDVTALSGAATIALRAQHVVTALPPRLLEASIALTPEPDASTRHRWQQTATWMAPHAKFFALYDRPFWRDAGLSGTAQSMVGPLVEIHDATTAAGEAALFGFLGVPAEQRATLGDEALKRACVDQLGRLFGEAALTPRQTLLKDWTTDPMTATPADRVAGGHVMAGAVEWVPTAWRGRMTVAGSEASPSESGYLAGAVIAAENAARETLRRIHG